MLRLKVVRTAEGEAESHMAHKEGVHHGTQATLDLTDHWKGLNRIIYRESYFVTTSTCEAMKIVGLRFIGAVKIATKGFLQPTLVVLKSSNAVNAPVLCV